MMDFHHLKTQESRRKAILQDQNNACNKCHNDTWFGQPLTLELEHKDGNSQNNARENLECLCPNCHSQTPTWRGRNKGKSRSISDNDFAAAIRECGTIHPALIRLGLAPKGGNYVRAKRIVEEYGILTAIPSGHKTPNATLSQDQADEMRRLRKDGCTYRDLCTRFDVGIWVVKGVLSGKTYK